MNREENRLSTADLARMREYEAPKTGDRVINRGDVPPKPHEAEAAVAKGYPQRTEQAEALWDETVQNPAAHDSRREAQRAENAETPRDRAGKMGGDGHLFQDSDLSDMRRRWSDVQASFVDEPRRAVEQADALVAETMQRLAQTFASARENLEHQWDRGDDVTTEDLRVTLQRYRAFFDRLLSM
jgi:hypothetical protein